MAETSGIVFPSVSESGNSEVVLNPSDERWKIYFTGRMDDVGPPLVRGGGGQIRVEYTTAESGPKALEILFGEPVELHDGEAQWGPDGAWGADDELSLGAKLPAAATTPNAGLGNCNLTDIGGYNLITPAAGDGSHDVVLADVAPIINKTKTGYWDVDKLTGEVTAANPGEGNCDLLDVEVMEYFVKSVAMTRRNPAIFEVENYSSQWVHQNWRLVLEVTRATTPAVAAVVTAWLTLFRAKRT